MARVREMRGGKDYDASFGASGCAAKASGPTCIAQRLEKAIRALRPQSRATRARRDAVSKAADRPADGQQDLFG